MTQLVLGYRYFVVWKNSSACIEPENDFDDVAAFHFDNLGGKFFGFHVVGRITMCHVTKVILIGHLHDIGIQGYC